MTSRTCLACAGTGADGVNALCADCHGTGLSPTTQTTRTIAARVRTETCECPTCERIRAKAAPAALSTQAAIRTECDAIDIITDPSCNCALCMRLREERDEIRAMLLAKNAAYGDSALAPVRVFSRADPTDALLVRIDDKLSRIARGSAAGEDVVLDLIGYLVLLRIAQRKAGT